MTYSKIDTDKAFRSYKFIGHPQAKALALLQREVLAVANRIKVSHALQRKYPHMDGGCRDMLMRDHTALYALLNVKRALKGNVL